MMSSNMEKTTGSSLTLPPDLESQGRPQSEQEESQPPPIKDTDSDPNILTWDANDPEHPQNWSIIRKTVVTGIWVYGNLVTCIASSIFSSGSTAISHQFDVSTTVVTLGMSLFLVGYTVGPPIWGPLSEHFGRKYPLLIGMVFFTIFCIPCALGTNIQTIIVGRFLTGVFGAAPLSIVGGSLVDMWNPVQRGLAMAACIGTIFGSPILAPLMGNFITQSHMGWRFTQWLSCIMGGSCSIIVLLVLPETYAPAILAKRAARLRKKGNPDVRTAFDSRGKSINEIVRVHLVRPFILLTTEPILVLITIYQAFIYGILYLVFVSYPISFREVRHWALGVSALPFLGMMVGVLMGCATVVITTRRGLKSRSQNQQSDTLKPMVVIPEDRLLIMIIGGILLPIGLFIFAWTSDPSIHWSGMVIGSAPIGMGMYIVFVQCLNYIVDVYPTIANSAISANTFVRSFFGAGFPLFGPAMYHRLGVNWATSLLGFISIAMVPIPVLFYIYGRRIRGWSNNARNA